MMTTLDLMTTHPFLEGLPTAWLERLSHQGKRAVHHTGHRLFREGGRADRFWLIRDGRASLEFNVPGRGDIAIEELGPGSVLGWSWMFPPYQWHFGAVAAEQMLSIEFDGPGVRRLCGDDPALGYELTSRFSAVLVDRLQAARLRLVDLYGYPASQAP
jgi:CRP/FNR family transcriptional regulator, cyclic AMP receptor protein